MHTRRYTAYCTAHMFSISISKSFVLISMLFWFTHGSGKSYRNSQMLKCYHHYGDIFFSQRAITLPPSHTQVNVTHVTARTLWGQTGRFPLEWSIPWSIHGLFPPNSWSIPKVHTHNFKAWDCRSGLMGSGHRMPMSNVRNKWDHGMRPWESLFAYWICWSVIHNMT